VGHFIYLLIKFLKHGGVKEKPYSVAEEKVGLRCQNHHVEKLSRVFVVTLQIKGAKLRDVKLKVISENRVEVWVDTTLFEVLDCSFLMGIHANHGFCHVVCFVF